MLELFSEIYFSMRISGFQYNFTFSTKVMEFFGMEEDHEEDVVSAQDLIKIVADRVEQLVSKMTLLDNDHRPQIYQYSNAFQIYENIDENLSRLEDSLRSPFKIFQETLSDKSQQKFEKKLRRYGEGQQTLNELLETLRAYGQYSKENPDKGQPINKNIVIVIPIIKSQPKSEEKHFFEVSKEKDKQRKTGELQFRAAMGRLQTEFIKKTEAEEEQDQPFNKLQQLNRGTIKHLQQINDGISQQLEINEHLTKQMEHLEKIFGEVGKEEHRYSQKMEEREIVIKEGEQSQVQISKQVLRGIEKGETEQDDFGSAMDLLQNVLMVHLKQLAEGSREEMDFGKLKTDNDKVGNELRIIQEGMKQQMKINEELKQEVVKPPEDKLFKEGQSSKHEEVKLAAEQREEDKIMVNTFNRVPSKGQIQTKPNQFKSEHSTFDTRSQISEISLAQLKYQKIQQDSYIKLYVLEESLGIIRNIQELSQKHKNYKDHQSGFSKNKRVQTIKYQNSQEQLVNNIEMGLEVVKINNKSFEQYIEELQNKQVYFDVESCETKSKHNKRKRMINMQSDSIQVQQMSLQLIMVLQKYPIEFILKCSGKRYINLKANNLSSIKLNSLPSLKVLDLSYNKLKLIELQKLDNLVNLNLNGNNLTASDCIFHLSLPALQKLDLSRNNLEGFDLPFLPSLQILDLSQNPLRKVAHLQTAKNLKQFYLDKAQLSSSISNIVYKAHALSILSLRQNSLQSIDLDKIRQDIPHITRLDLSYNKLINIVIQREFSSLKELHLHSNRFKQLKFKSIFPDLELLDLQYNEMLTEITLQNLGKLKIVNLSSCQLETINLRSLDSLEQLHLKNNKFQRIALRNLNSLKSLNLFDNSRLESVDLSQLKSLSNLLLYDLLLLKGENCSLPPSIKVIEVDNSFAISYDFSKLYQLESLRIHVQDNQVTQEQNRMKLKGEISERVKLTIRPVPLFR